MKFLALVFILIGLAIILSVFWGYTLTFWKTLEFILGIIIIYFGFHPKQEVKIKKGKKEVILNGVEAEGVIDDILETQQGWFFKGLKIFHRNFKLKSLIFGLIAGIFLILDSLNIFEKSFNFWEVILAIFASWLIASGLSAIFSRRK
ncbi:hypothetical protein JCM30566_06140 [Marinitoga arctica]